MIHHILDRVSYHAVYDESILDALRYAKENGFSGVQVGVEVPHLSFERLSDAERGRIRQFLTDSGLYLVLHMPDESLSMFEASDYLRRGIFSYYEAAFEFAEQTGARLITLHLGSMPSFSTNTVPVQRIPAADIALYEQALRQNLHRLIELAGERFVLCVENYKADAAILDLLQEHLKSGGLTLCWDLAKTLDSSVEDYFWRNLHYIRQVHLHDWKPGGPSHRIIGTGNIDFMRFLPRLSQAQVMDFCIEVRPREAAQESLDRLRQMCAG